MPLNLRDLDRIRSELEHKHPGWRIWYVPHSDDGRITHAAWCGQKLPQFAEDSPEHLSQSIDEIEQEWRDAPRIRQDPPRP